MQTACLVAIMVDRSLLIGMLYGSGSGLRLTDGLNIKLS